MSVEGDMRPSVDDHPFIPRGAWWSLCKVCGFGEAAHMGSVIGWSKDWFAGEADAVERES